MFSGQKGIFELFFVCKQHTLMFGSLCNNVLKQQKQSEPLHNMYIYMYIKLNKYT